MAFLCRKLAAFLYSTHITSFKPHNTTTQSFRVLPFSRPVSNSIHTYRHFTAHQIQSHPKIVSRKPEVEGADLNEVEFRKWHGGGGMFHKSALIDPTAVIEFSAMVHSEAIVGPNVYIGAGTVVGPAVTIGQSSRIGYNVALSNCTIGEFCVIHNGACIGQDGFGFFVNEQGEMVKKPQNLKARIGNHVEIGSNTCVDRGSRRDTIIGDHTKIDNLVQIGHNVVIGKSCMVCGQVGIAGSVTIGDYVALGGRVGIIDHVCVASKVRLAANSCVTKNISEPGDYGGFPAVPIHEWRKQVATLRQTSKFAPLANTGKK